MTRHNLTGTALRTAVAWLVRVVLNALAKVAGVRR